MAISVTPAPLGKQTQTVNFGGTPLDVFTYRPSGEIKGVLLVFHGAGRDAEGIRDSAIQVATQKGYYVVSPLFDTDRFDSDLYQMGGLIDDSRFVTDRDKWTVSKVDEIAEWANARVGTDSSDDTVLFGHSAGGQFMSRVAAFGQDSTFDKMIIANPSTHVWPSLTEKVAYGFGGGYFSAAESEALLKDYLADPVTIYLGSEDNDPNHSQLSTGSAAMRQGDDRLERGLNAYNEGKAVAEAKGWDFNWELVIADGVGHSFGGMLRSPAMLDAIDNDDPIPEPSPTDPVVTKLGTSGNDSLTGTSGADVISGLAGADKLWGKAGNDILIGGSGKDAFTFDTILNATTNVDTIKDFSVVDDTIRLNDTIFTKVWDEGQLRSSWFRIGEKALDSNDYIVYNKNTGDLFYDKDGSGSADAVKFAGIENKALLTAADFIVI